MGIRNCLLKVILGISEIINFSLLETTVQEKAI